MTFTLAGEEKKITKLLQKLPPVTNSTKFPQQEKQFPEQVSGRIPPGKVHAAFSMSQNHYHSISGKCIHQHGNMSGTRYVSSTLWLARSHSQTRDHGSLIVHVKHETS